MLDTFAERVAQKATLRRRVWCLLRRSLRESVLDVVHLRTGDDLRRQPLKTLSIAKTGASFSIYSLALFRKMSSDDQQILGVVRPVWVSYLRLADVRVDFRVHQRRPQLYGIDMGCHGCAFCACRRIHQEKSA